LKIHVVEDEGNYDTTFLVLVSGWSMRCFRSFRPSNEASASVNIASTAHLTLGEAIQRRWFGRRGHDRRPTNHPRRRNDDEQSNTPNHLGGSEAHAHNQDQYPKHPVHCGLTSNKLQVAGETVEEGSAIVIHLAIFQMMDLAVASSTMAGKAFPGKNRSGFGGSVPADRDKRPFSGSDRPGAAHGIVKMGRRRGSIERR